MPRLRIFLAIILVLFSLQAVYGYGDWDKAGWINKYAINDFNVTRETVSTEVIRLDDFNFQDLNMACADANDFTIVNESSGTEVTDLNLANWDGTNTDQHLDVLFKPTETLTIGDYNGLYYIYTNYSTCTYPTNRTDLNLWKVYDNFDDNTIHDESSYGNGTRPVSNTYDLWDTYLYYEQHSIATINESNNLEVHGENQDGWGALSSALSKMSTNKLPDESTLGSRIKWDLLLMRAYVNDPNTYSYTRIFYGGVMLLEAKKESAFGTSIVTAGEYELHVEYDGSATLWLNGDVNKTWGAASFTDATDTNFYIYTYTEGPAFDPEATADVNIDNLRADHYDMNTDFDYSIGMAEYVYDVDGNVVYPNGGEIILNDFNVEFQVRSPVAQELHAKIAYSQTKGAFTNVIVEDANLNNYAADSNLSCTDINFYDWTTCTYQFTIPIQPADLYYLDLNIFAMNFDESIVYNNSRVDSSTDDFQIGYGRLRFYFSDEEIGGILNPSVTFDGNSYSTDGNGFLQIDLNYIDSARWITLSADDTNHSQRDWNMFIIPSTVSDYNFMLLSDANSASIAFELHSPSGAILNDANLQVLKDGNHVYVTTTDSSGNVTLYLDSIDSNYNFIIEAQDGNTYNYFSTSLIIKIPKDEQTMALITPYDIIIGGLGSQDWNGLTADLNTLILSDTEDYYNIYVVDENNNYYQRKYVVRALNQAETYTLQPYLVDSDNGIISWFYIKDYYTRRNLGDVQIVSKKQISGSFQTVESVETDDTGTATLSFVSLHDYYLDFYYDGNFIGTKHINASSTSYYVDLISSGLVYQSGSGGLVDVNITPNILVQQADGNVTIYIQVSTTVGDITAIDVLITHGGTTLVNDTITENVAWGGTWSYEIDANSLNPIKPIMEVVTIHGSLYTAYASQYIQPIASQYSIMTSLQDVRDDMLGGQGGFGAIVVAIFVTLAVCGFVITRITRNAIGITVLGGCMMMFFTYIGFIPVEAMIFIAGAFIVGLLIERRWT